MHGVSLPREYTRHKNWAFAIKCMQHAAVREGHQINHLSFCCFCFPKKTVIYQDQCFITSAGSCESCSTTVVACFEIAAHLLGGKLWSTGDVDCGVTLAHDIIRKMSDKSSIVK